MNICKHPEGKAIKGNPDKWKKNKNQVQKIGRNHRKEIQMPHVSEIKLKFFSRNHI
jgi:hypothetical protein